MIHNKKNQAADRKTSANGFGTAIDRDGYHVLQSMSSLMERMGGMDKTILTEVRNRQASLLTEDTRIDRVKGIIRDTFDSLFPSGVNGTVHSDDYYVNNNPNTTWEQYLMYNLRHTLNLMSNSDVRLLPNAARIAYDELYLDLDDKNKQQISIFKKMLNMLKQDPQAVNEFVNGTPTYDSLYQVYGRQMEMMDNEMFKRMSQKEYTPDDRYDVIPIRSRAEAYKYAKYSGVNGQHALCFALTQRTWNDFSKEGENACYLCLRKDWQDIPCQMGDGYPKDDYGLSMVFVFINPEGRINTSNVRWNHGIQSFPNVDDMFTEEELADLVGRPYHDTFKPAS